MSTLTPDHVATLQGGPLHNQTLRIPRDSWGHLPYLADIPTGDGGVATYRLTPGRHAYAWTGETLAASDFTTTEARERMINGARVVHDPAHAAG